MSTTQVENNAGQRTIKNFKSSPDVENFFRFVHENDLRKEARMILEAVCKALEPKKKRRKRRSKKVQ
jgi:pantoate kinase